VEVLNDLDMNIVNFLRVCQLHHEELIRYLRYTVVSRAWFAILAATDPGSLTDVQRAARFFYLQKNCFGGLVIKQHFHYGVVQRPNFNPERIPEILEQAHRRLMRVQIENLPHQEILKRYDRPTTLFYLDPPYWRRKLYNYNFSDAAFQGLEEQLQRIQGRFILSLDDCEEVRDIFGAWRFTKVLLSYTAQKKAKKRYGELLITNFQPQRKEPASSEADSESCSGASGQQEP
jgi:DNA adenine methylase